MSYINARTLLNANKNIYRISPATEDHDAVYDVGIIGSLEEDLIRHGADFKSEIVTLDELHHIYFLCYQNEGKLTTDILFCETDESSLG